MIKQALKGMNDFIPRDAEIRDYMMSQILKVYKSFGFERIYTPAIEDINILLHRYICTLPFVLLFIAGDSLVLIVEFLMLIIPFNVLSFNVPTTSLSDSK